MEDKNNQIIIYNTEDGQTKIEVKMKDETVWLSQKQMADLFQKDRKTITEHIQNVFKDGELAENSVCRKFQHTASDGKKYDVNFYNLDVIISVGYRVSSLRGTQFLSFAELQSVEQRVMYMKNWVEKLDGFLILNEKEILNDAGDVSHKEMEQKVREELARYNQKMLL